MTAKALAYIRTSSAANVGSDKDSEKRQREAITNYAARAGFEIVAWFNDPAVKGSDDIDKRPGFGALLERIVGNGAKIVLVEDASRFARKLLVQEAGIALLEGLGVRVLTANGDDLTDSDDEFRVAMRQIVGVFSQLEKSRLVKKLRGARQRKKAATGKCEGRKSHAQLRPDVVKLAHKLHGQGLALRPIGAQLAAAGFLNMRGQPYSAQSVKQMLAQRP